MRIDPTAFSPGEALLWRHGVVAPEHIDLDAIAAVEGAEVRYRALDGCEARLVVFGERGIISVKPEPKYRGRQRFSLAHELAHWMRDRSVGGVLCAAEDISPSNTEAKDRESAANAYASQLVLPDYLVAPRAAGLGFTIDAAEELAGVFRSSLTAAVLKLLRHIHRSAAVVCHRPNGGCWFRKSRALPPDAFILDELHHDSPAIKLLHGGEGGRTRAHAEPALHWMSGPPTRGKNVSCQSLKLPDGAVLTTLELLR